MNLVTAIVSVASAIICCALVAGCGEKPIESPKPVTNAVFPTEAAKNDYVAETPEKSAQCKRKPQEIFADKKRRQSLEGWKKLASEHCPEFTLNEKTTQLSAYYANERYIVSLSEHGTKGNQTLYVVNDVILISQVCRKEQTRMQKCIDDGKDLMVCLDAVSKPAPQNCPMTMD